MASRNLIMSLRHGGILGRSARHSIMRASLDRGTSRRFNDPSCHGLDGPGVTSLGLIVST